MKKRKRLSVHCKLDAVKSLHARITQYLTDLFASGSLNEEQASQSAGIMYVLSDVDRMGILCGEVAGGIKEKMEKKYKYSKEAMKDLGKSLELIETMYSEVREAIVSGKLEHAKELVKKREKVMELDISMRKAHMSRVSKGKCDASLTAPFNSILYSIDRMGNSCVNIADTVQGQLELNSFQA